MLPLYVDSSNLQSFNEEDSFTQLDIFVDCIGNWKPKIFNSNPVKVY